MKKRENRILLFVSIALFFVCLFAFMYAWTQLSQTVPGVPGYDEYPRPAVPMLRESARIRMELTRTGSIAVMALSGLGILYFAAASGPRSE